jgi:3'-phosphoadenosine 5'-phosphosulfate sulfotransferase (PAPS reductase)/FAD synthetase
MNPYEFYQKQSLPYEAKIVLAERRAWEFYDKLNGNCYVSVGGLDSITLLLFLRSIGIDVPAVSVSSLEDKSIQAIHRQLGVERIRPIKTQKQVIAEYGYPIISKEKARKIETLQVLDNPKQTFIHALITGDMGAQGGFQHSKKLKLPDKWLKLFGGNYQAHRPDFPMQTAPFKISARCCYWMKEKPCDDYARQSGRHPYMGLMASEGGQREKGLMKNGCNYFGKTVTRSCPFAIFMRQDLLQLALDLDVPVPEIYGEIVRDDQGDLRTTKAQRTGCAMCGFGIHIEKRPHRYDRLRDDNPKYWNYLMYDQGWGDVLDYIGVGWRDVPKKPQGGAAVER